MNPVLSPHRVASSFAVSHVESRSTCECSSTSSMMIRSSPTHAISGRRRSSPQFLPPIKTLSIADAGGRNGSVCCRTICSVVARRVLSHPAHRPEVRRRFRPRETERHALQIYGFAMRRVIVTHSLHTPRITRWRQNDPPPPLHSLLRQTDRRDPCSQ